MSEYQVTFTPSSVRFALSRWLAAGDSFASRRFVSFVCVFDRACHPSSARIVSVVVVVSVVFSVAIVSSGHEALFRTRTLFAIR